jgi:hypothetical protein
VYWAITGWLSRLGCEPGGKLGDCLVQGGDLGCQGGDRTGLLLHVFGAVG